MKLLLSLIFCVFVHSSNYNISGLDAEWDSWKKVHYIIRKWSKQQVERLNLKIDEVVFYPFGGGDITPMNFFPNFSKMVIIGLEPTGVKFSLEDEDGIRENLRFFLRRGFFVTKDMEQFKHSGILTVILVQLNQIGAQNMQYIVGMKNNFRTFTVTFDWEGKKREITYIQANLNNANYNNWKTIFDEYGNFTLFIKGASFVLQQIGFEKIKAELIGKSNMIFQDDTGIKYKELQTFGYQTALFGSYYLPYTMYGLKIYFQEELKMAYQQEAVHALPFSISYRSHQVDPNMLIAYKNCCAKNKEDQKEQKTLDSYDLCEDQLPENLLDE